MFKHARPLWRGLFAALLGLLIGFYYYNQAPPRPDDRLVGDNDVTI